MVSRVQGTWFLTTIYRGGGDGWRLDYSLIVLGFKSKVFHNLIFLLG